MPSATWSIPVSDWFPMAEAPPLDTLPDPFDPFAALASPDPPPAALRELLEGATAPWALERLVLPLVQQVQRFAQEGFGLMRQAYHARDLLYGREVVCSDGLAGTARGVDASGALLVHTETGLRKITSAEVSVRPVPETPDHPSELVSPRAQSVCAARRLASRAALMGVFRDFDYLLGQARHPLQPASFQVGGLSRSRRRNIPSAPC